jgi:ketosteroid isomerase-like protein
MTEARNANEQLVIDFFATLSTGDLARVRTFIDDDTTWEPMVKDVPGAGEHRGAAICDEFLGPVRGLFKAGDPKVHVDNLVSSDNLVMCETRGIGTLADGRPYHNQYAWAIQIDGGRIKRIREYFDSNYVFTLLGSGQ